MKRFKESHDKWNMYVCMYRKFITEAHYEGTNLRTNTKKNNFLRQRYMSLVLLQYYEAKLRLVKDSQNLRSFLKYERKITEK